MSDNSEIAVLAQRIESIEQELKEEKTQVRELKKQQDLVDRKISTAETVGRLVIYALLAASAFFTQVQGFLKWLRNG